MTYDAIAEARKLEASGFPREQAEGLIQILIAIKNGEYEIGSDKARIRQLEDRVTRLEKELDNKRSIL